MVSKFVIINEGDEDHGKTSSLKLVWKLLKDTYKDDINILVENLKYYNPIDICVIVELYGTKIGICSYGDEEACFYKAIIEFLNRECDIMVLACRPITNFLYEINRWKNQGWTIIEMANEYTDDPNKYEECNMEYAQKVVDRIIEKITTGN